MLEGIVRDSITKTSCKALEKRCLIANIYGKGMENISAAFKKKWVYQIFKNKTTLCFWLLK